jgi:CheY-like chemotaxis protein
MHILIIEDNPADAFLTRMALQRERTGDEITLFGDGEPAIEYLSGNPPPKVDLILLDLNLPRVDGLTFLRWLWEQPGIREIPVFILSSSPADAFAEAAAAVAKYLEKPATLDEYMLVGRIVADYFARTGEFSEDRSGENT